MAKNLPAEARHLAVEAEAREHKRGAIERAAYLCFCRRGYHGTAVDDICKAAGISKGSFYWYFDGKQSVFHGILDRWVKHVEALLDSGFGAAAKLPDAFSALTIAMEAEMDRYQRLLPVWLEYLSQAQRDADVRERLSQMHERIRAAIERFLRVLFATAMSGDDYRAFATMIMACFIGLSCDAMVNSREGAIVRDLERVMRFIAAQQTPAAKRSPKSSRKPSLEPPFKHSLKSPPQEAEPKKRLPAAHRGSRRKSA